MIWFATLAIRAFVSALLSPCLRWAWISSARSRMSTKEGSSTFDRVVANCATVILKTSPNSVASFCFVFRVG